MTHVLHKHNNIHAKTIGPLAAKLIALLYEQNKPIFSLNNVQKLLDIGGITSRDLVRRLVDNGVAARLKPGLFILVPFELGKEHEYTGNPLIVAREILRKEVYYLSHGTAMEIHGMVTQPRLIVYVTVAKQRRPIDIKGITFTFITTEKKLFFGISDHWVTKQEKVRVSNIERTVIDGLKQPRYCGGISEVAKGLWMHRDDINVDRLVNYAVKMKKGSVICRLGFILELYEIGTAEKREILRCHLSEAYSQLDPSLPAEGKFFRRWRLQLNVSPEELLTVVRT